MSAASKILTALMKYGRPMKLRRRIGTTATFQDVTVSGVSSNYAPEELVGVIQQGDRRIVISNQEILAQVWPGPPRKNDILVVDGANTAVQAAEPKHLGTEILAWVLQVRG